MTNPISTSQVKTQATPKPPVSNCCKLIGAILRLALGIIGIIGVWSIPNREQNPHTYTLDCFISAVFFIALAIFVKTES